MLGVYLFKHITDVDDSVLEISAICIESALWSNGKVFAVNEVGPGLTLGQVILVTYNKICIQVATMPDAICYRVSAKTGLPSVNRLWLS